MKLITWNVQWCRGVDGRVDPDADRRGGARARRLRRAVPAGDRRQLSGSAARRQHRRRPVRRARVAAARATRRRPESPSIIRREGRPAQALRQHDPVAAADAAGLPASASVAGRPRRERDAANRGRGGRRGAVRRGPRHHHAPRVLLAEAAQRAGRGAARDLRRRGTDTRSRERSSIRRADRSTRICVRRRRSSPATSTSSPTIRCMRG